MRFYAFKLHDVLQGYQNYCVLQNERENTENNNFRLSRFRKLLFYDFFCGLLIFTRDPRL